MVCDSIREELASKQSVDLFGERRQGDFNGFCIGTGYGLFGLYLQNDKLTMSLVNHEVFHLTCQILRYHNCPCNEQNEEHAALLNEYLNNEIWKNVYQFITDENLVPN